MKKIGIIGGAGPEAGALLFKNIIHIYQERGFWEDYHFPRIMLLSNNFSSMIDANVNRLTIINEIQTAVNILNVSNNEVIGIACNTLHSFIKNVDFKDMNFVSIIDVVIKSILQRRNTRILFLGTKTSVLSKIYEITNAVTIVYPTVSNQELIHELILRILKNQHSKIDSLLLYKIINDSKKNMNFDGVILGCTELSIVHQNFNIQNIDGLVIFDPIAILANAMTSI